MALIVAIHGVGQQLRGENVLREEWLPALRDGLIRVGVNLPADENLWCAFYGDLFRKKETKSLGDPVFDANDLTDNEDPSAQEWERELLEAWWREAAAVEDEVPGPDARTKLRTPQIVQRALNALSNSKFWAGIAEKALIFDLKQVRRYLHDEALRREVRSRVAEAVSPDTKVMIAHSLGSVVAYECLCTHPEWSVQTLVTLGSPLGIRNLIFDKLQPAPQGGIGAWPGSVQQWTNIADKGDVVAMVKDLRPRFSDRVKNQLIHNGAKAHNVSPYLTAEETGRAIAAGLKR